MKITLLVDKNSWINKYLHIFENYIQKNGYEYEVVNEYEDATKFDVCMCLSFSKLLPESFLDNHKHVLVVHESDLPNGKGWSPMSWQILEGKREITISLFEASKQLDAGEIYIKKKIVINETELFDDWRKKQAESSFKICAEWLEKYPDILLAAESQEGESTFYEKRTKEDSQLNINKSIKDQFNLLRIVDNENYPAFFKINSKKFIIKIYNEEDSYE